MATDNITIVNLKNKTIAESAPYLYQWDYGQKLYIKGINLPDNYEAHFCNIGDKYTKTVFCTNELISIPDEYFRKGKDIIVYLYLHFQAEDGETEYEITIPIRPRPRITDDAPIPTPEERSEIEEIIRNFQRIQQRMEASALLTEGYAVGTHDGVPVATTDPTYQNNAKYFAEQAQRRVSEIDTLIYNKVDKISGKGLSTNDFTNEYKNILDNIEDYGHEYFAGTGLALDSSGTFALASNVISPGSAGPSAAVMGNNDVVVQIPRITVDTYGRVTGLTDISYTSINTTYSVATPSTDGLLSSADKILLNKLTVVEVTN